MLMFLESRHLGVRFKLEFWLVLVLSKGFLLNPRPSTQSPKPLGLTGKC